MNTRQCYENILGIVCSVFDAYSAVLFMPGSDQETFELTASFSLGEMISHNAAAAPGKGLVGWILRNRQPLLVNNFDQRQSHLGYYRSNEEATIKAFMGCPVRGGGALCIDSKRQYSFSDKDQKILHLFTELLADIYSEDSRESVQASVSRYYASLSLVHELRARYTRWPLYLHHFLKIVSEATGFEYCLFATRDASGDAYTVEGESRQLLLHDGGSPTFPMGNGIVGWVFRNDAPVFSEGTDGSPAAALFGKGVHMPVFQSVMCLPVIVHKVTRGVLCFAQSEPRRMSDELRDFSRMSVDIVALFLENLYLRNRLRQTLPQAQVQRRMPAYVSAVETPEAGEDN